jgi:dienelactone hydrolase
VASLLLHFAYDSRDGRAYRVDVPAQLIDAHLEGWAEKEPEPEEPSEPASWREVEVDLPARQGPLPGLLTLPLTGEGPWPGLVFLHGSGPHDRDETIGANKPFRDLAHGLAEQGIASLRYDKRTHLLVQGLRAGGEARAQALEALEGMKLREETVEDGVAALEWLREREEVGPTFLLGHSLGALAAPEVGSEVEGLAGLVLLAGPGRPMDVLTQEQIVYQNTVAGQSAEEAARHAEELVAEPLRKALAGELPDTARILGLPVLYWKDILERDAPAALAASRRPVLLLQGEKDCQVRMADYELLVAALEKREGVPHRARLFPDLNHLFMKVDGKSTGAEYFREGHVAGEVIEEIASWVLEVAGE